MISWPNSRVDPSHSSFVQLLDDFEDVSTDEKRFFKLWNEFFQQLHFVAQNSLPSHCMSFVKNHASFLHKESLEEQLIWHLTNLWHEGHIGREHLLAAMTKYHEIVSRDLEDATPSSIINSSQR